MTAIHSSYIALAALLLVGFEALWRLFARADGYDFKSAAASFGVFAGNIASKALSAAITTPVYLTCWALAPIQLPIDDWRVWAAGFFVVEFAYYWMHRWSHEVRWIWATHSVHHSSAAFTFPAALRLGWTGAISGGWLVFAPIILAGFPPLMAAALLAFNLQYQFILHTEIVGKLGPLEYLFNTPSHHRVHHASNKAYLDRNFGGVLIIFDRLFGTFAEENAGEPLKYGLTRPVASNNPFVIAFSEWARMAADVAAAKTLREGVAAMFGRPAAVCLKPISEPTKMEVDMPHA